jgi:hypothetical protein
MYAVKKGARNPINILYEGVLNTMRNKGRKILSIIAAAACLSTAFAFAGCGEWSYKGDKLDGYVSSAEVKSNGGFAVDKGDYVYFINGVENYQADNTYGNVVKGALLRVAKSDIAKGDYSNVKTVVPMLFVAGDTDAGVFIYGDYVYYATPTTDKNKSGEVQNDYIDFKRAKIDGSEAAMQDYYVRLSNRSTNYRYVEENGVVYLLYEEGGALKSFNTKTEKTTVLVMPFHSGVNSSSSFLPIIPVVSTSGTVMVPPPPENRKVNILIPPCFHRKGRLHAALLCKQPQK